MRTMGRSSSYSLRDYLASGVLQSAIVQQTKQMEGINKCDNLSTDKNRHNLQKLVFDKSQRIVKFQINNNVVNGLSKYMDRHKTKQPVVTVK